jgi:hypothetical protein
MRAHAVILVGFLGAALPLDAVQAQLSPQGILGGITRPFRHMLGHLGHYPRVHRHRGGARAAAASPDRDTQGVVRSRLGRAGPAAWPSAYEDVVGFTFWPSDYAARLRGRGFDVLADTITGQFDRIRPTRVATTGAARNDTGSDVSAAECTGALSPNDRWPATRLEQIFQLSDAQRDALDKLQATVSNAIKDIKANCRELGDLSGPDRLRALVQSLWVVRDGGMAIRTPLKGFYENLASAQKNSLTIEQPQSAPPDAKVPESANKQYQACASQNIGSAERMIKEIEMKVRPDKTQAASLENLHKTSSDMAKLLIASCAQPIPADPLARVDAANDQITAMNYAATNVQIALDEFYGRLSQQQKARFEATGR